MPGGVDVHTHMDRVLSLHVDSYEWDWSRLWWVRADGRARGVGDGPELELAIGHVLDRYPQ